MPLIAILAGLTLIAVAYRGTEHALSAQLTSDFGSGGAGSQFVAWAAALLALGALGYVPKMRQLSNLAMALVIVVLVLRNQGIFGQLAGVIDNPPAAMPSVPLAAYSGGGGMTGAQASAGGPGVGNYAANISGDAASGAVVGGPYGAAAGAAYGAISTAFG